MAGDDPLIGRTLGNYVVLEQLGAGGMGAVYLAEHPEIGLRVAIKVLPKHLCEAPRFAARFKTEARAVTRLQHPNIIRINDFGRSDDGLLYQNMELLQGQEPFSRSELLDAVRRVLDG